MPTIPRKISCSTSTPMNHPQACCCASLTSAPIHITNITTPQATRTKEAIVTPGGGLPAGAPRAIKPVAIPTSTANTHAPMYHRVVIRLLMACLLIPPRNLLPLLVERGCARRYLSTNRIGRGGRIRTLGPRFWSFWPAPYQRRLQSAASSNRRLRSTYVGPVAYTVGYTDVRASLPHSLDVGRAR